MRSNGSFAMVLLISMIVE